MPFRSEAQRRKFAEMVKQGKMTQAEFDKWNHQTPKKIPERVGKKEITSVQELRAIAKQKR